MKIKTMVAALALLMFFTLTGCTQNNKAASDNNKSSDVTLTVSAAASLSETMEEIKELYEKNHKNIHIVYNFGGSGSLQHQIEQGAEVDIFICAAEKQMKSLEDKGLILNESKVDLLKNKIVLITPKNVTDINKFEEVAKNKVDKIALGEPSTVPAGQYAEEVFKSLGILDKVKSKAVYAKDVREVLTWVESGNAKAGVVYETDAISSDKVNIVAVANSSYHSPVIYPAAIIKSSKNLDASKEFMEFLNSDNAKKVYKKYGFTCEDW